MKSAGGKSQTREERRRKKKIREEKSQKKEDAGAGKGRKLASHFTFPMICGPGSKSSLAKAEPCGRMRDGKLHSGVARITLRSKNVQSTPAPSTFGRWYDEKVHAVVARGDVEVKGVKNGLVPARTPRRVDF